MQCAICGAALVREDDCHSCTACGAVWFAFEAARRAFGLQHLPEELAPPPLPLEPRGRTCPECAIPLATVPVDQRLTLDQCQRCSGLLLEAGESLALRGRLAAGHDPGFRLRLASIVAGPVIRRGPYR